MKKTILHFDDDNMAGYGWSWTFFLNETANGKFTLSCKQTVHEDYPTRIPAIRGLRDGVDVYDALRSLAEQTWHRLSDEDLPAIAEAIKEVDPLLVGDFLNGEVLSSQREQLQAYASEAGKMFLAAGFALEQTGGGRSAWMRPVVNGWSIRVTNDEGTGHFVEDGGCWMVAAHSGDGKDLVTLDMPAPTRVADALRIAAYLTSMVEARAATRREPDVASEGPR